MGYGVYSSDDRHSRATKMGYFTGTVDQIFTSQDVEEELDVKEVGAGLRESRDSDEHPNSVPVIIALDVTGSMGTVPHNLVKDGLPTMVASVIDGGTDDPQILFLAIGDHKCDRVPLQAAQFESNDELLDKWLTKVYLEGRGGGNNGESYMLAWYFAAFHTVTDSFEKRGRKGFLFTIGDEPVHDSLPVEKLKAIMGTDDVGQGKKSFSSSELLDEAKKTYNVYHLHIMQGHNGRRQDVIEGWKEIMGENCVTVEDYNQVAEVMSRIVNDVVNGNKPMAEDNVNEEIL